MTVSIAYSLSNELSLSLCCSLFSFSFTYWCVRIFTHQLLSATFSWTPEYVKQPIHNQHKYNHNNNKMKDDTTTKKQSRRRKQQKRQYNRMHLMKKSTHSQMDLLRIHSAKPQNNYNIILACYAYMFRFLLKTQYHMHTHDDVRARRSIDFNDVETLFIKRNIYK